MKEHDTQILVLGGGIVGMTAALALHSLGYDVALLCRSKEMAPSFGRVYAINHASQKLFQKLHVWENIAASKTAPFQKMEIWEKGTNAKLSLDGKMARHHELGFMIDDVVLREALLLRLKEEHVPCYFETEVTKLETTQEGVIAIAEHHIFRAKLLVAADGALSETRERLNVSEVVYPYHQTALTVTVRTEFSHEQTAFQVFSEEGILAFLPLEDPHCSAIVWSLSDKAAKANVALSEEDFAEKLANSFEHRQGKVEVISPRHTFPLKMRYAKQFSGENWMLLGDAAHTIHPLAGLGLNLGLSGLNRWLLHLEASHASVFSKATLRAYEREQKHAVMRLVALTGGLKTLFMNPLPPVRMLRRWGLSTVNEWPMLKEWLMEEARG